MLSVKNTYRDILNIKSALLQSKLIINKLEKENSSLKKTLNQVIPNIEIEPREYLHYEHIHFIN
mgnify:FL=1|tara:strand:- start:184 stop:375 length:192 start_codon:yes stop_codon:yes gene_type:complete